MPSDLELDFDLAIEYERTYIRPRNNSLIGSVSATEETPLIDIEAEELGVGTPVRSITSIVLLALVLLGGIGIGTYLLVLQHNSDNILPPVNEVPMRHVVRSVWDQQSLAMLPVPPFRAENVIIEHTETGKCHNLTSCVPLLRKLQMRFGDNGSLPYNFLLSSDGVAYEGLGCSKLSPLYPELKPFVLAFIGNYSKNAMPDVQQMEMAQCLITDFLSKNLLFKNYTVIGELYDNFKYSPQWKKIQSGLSCSS